MNKKFRNRMRGCAFVAIMLVFVLMIGACSDATNTGLNDSNASNTTGTVNNPGETEPKDTETTVSTQPTEETSPATDSATEPTVEPTVAPTVEPTVAPTVEPTVAPTTPAEPEPTVSFKDVNETVYATGTVNVRSGPSTDSSKLGSLSKGDQVTRTGIGSNGWSRIAYNGNVAYVYSQYLSLTKPNTAPPAEAPDSDLPVTKPDSVHDLFDDVVNERVYVTEKTNVYLTPNTESAPIGTLNKGDVVTRTSRGRLVGWNQIDYNGQRAYVQSTCLSTKDPSIIAAEEHGYKVGDVITVTDSKGTTYTLKYLGEDRWEDQNGTIWRSYEHSDGRLHFSSFS